MNWFTKQPPTAPLSNGIQDPLVLMVHANERALEDSLVGREATNIRWLNRGWRKRWGSRRAA